MPELTRRSFLALTASAAAFATRPAWSQQGEPFSYDGILPFIWDAPVVRDLVLQPDLNEEQTMHYVGRDFHSRTGLVSAAHLMGAFETRDQAVRYLEGLGELSETAFPPDSLVSQMHVIEGLLAENLPLIPQTSSVQPVRLAMIEPQPAIPPGDRAILGRILADTLEIAPEDLPDDETLEDSAELMYLLDGMLAQTQAEDWPELAEGAERLLRKSVTSRRLAAIHSDSRPRVLYNLAVSCVPLIGWTYMSARLTASIRRNRHRFSFG
jgi:hypothetical protein